MTFDQQYRIRDALRQKMMRSRLWVQCLGPIVQQWALIEHIACDRNINWSAQDDVLIRQK